MKFAKTKKTPNFLAAEKRFDVFLRVADILFTQAF